jgi:hypothetical protein
MAAREPEVEPEVSATANVIAPAATTAIKAKMIASRRLLM